MTLLIAELRRNNGTKQREERQAMDTSAAPSGGTKRTAPDKASSGEEASKEPSKMAPKAAPKEAPKETPRETPREAPKEAPEALTAAASSSEAAPGNSGEKAATSSAGSAEQSPKAPRIPPVILREKGRWMSVSKKLTEKKIRFTKARLIGEGIQIHPETVDDYRKMTRYMTDAKIGYHTYALPEESQLRVVMRGLPNGTTDKEIREDLEGRGFTPSEVLRMTDRRTNRKMPVALIKAPLDQEKILVVNRCCSLVVRVERQRDAVQAALCFRCQRFGHAQSKCTAEAKCVKTPETPAR